MEPSLTGFELAVQRKLNGLEFTEAFDLLLNAYRCMQIL